jgi:hypothetical protein
VAERATADSGVPHLAPCWIAVVSEITEITEINQKNGVNCDDFRKTTSKHG